MPFWTDISVTRNYSESTYTNTVKILVQLAEHKGLLEAIMANQADLENELTQLKTEIGATAQRVLDALAKLPVGADLQPQVDEIAADVKTLQGIAPTTPTPTP